MSTRTYEPVVYLPSAVYSYTTTIQTWANIWPLGEISVLLAQPNDMYART